ncbi:uncharacterized protein [Drosophila kikkawai]|uniref:Uncharacterized protein n=1 Tax=Drosophila kikkawai TaxID=30033 RepID=A0A6P4INT8_DROKI|nr:putative mediator of RNA polymerase II transcription subunit 24 [Drosophila kikkawai]
MNLPTTIILLVFAVVAWAVDPPSNQTVHIEDSPDFVDDDGAQPAALFVGFGVTEATIITATPTNENTTSASTRDTSSTTVTSTTESSTATSTVITTTASTTTTPKPPEEEIFLALLAENTVALTKSDFLANILNSETSNIISDLDKQVKSLSRINDIEKLLLNVTGSLAVSEADLLQSLVNSIYKVDYFGNRTINTVSYLLRFRELNRDRVNNFSSKLIGMQEQILRNSKGLDDKLSLVKQILKQYITPRVNNLKESFGHINVSQVTSEDELSTLPLLRNLTETSIIKATSLLNQLAMLNQTQDKSLYNLEEAVNKPEFANLNNINELLHIISISQKRIDLAISVCENRPTEYNANKYEPYSENHLPHSKNCSCKAKTNDLLSEQSWNIKAAV